MDMLCKRGSRIFPFLTEVVIDLLSAFLRIDINMYRKEALLFGPQYSQQSVRRNALKRLGIIEITSVFHSLLTGRLLCSLGDDTSGPEYLPQRLTYRCGLAQTLSYDIPRACKDVINSLYLLIDIFTCFRGRICHLDVIHSVSKRLESGLLGNCSTSPALRLIWQINIFKFSRLHTRVDSCTKFIRHGTGLRNRLKDSFLALVHLGKDLSPMPYFCHRNFIQSSRTFLSVAADERNCSSFLEKSCTILHLPLLDLQTLRYTFDIYILNHVKPVSTVRDKMRISWILTQNRHRSCHPSPPADSMPPSART